MANEHDHAAAGATTAATDEQPSEQEMRAAYEAELARITSSEMILQTAVSLLNIGGRRLGLGGSSAEERDLEQVRDAIDGVSALMPILERRMPRELGPLRDAIAQLQVAYARESSAGSDSSRAPQASQTSSTAPTPKAVVENDKPAKGEPEQGPGPAQASGRLWVPGR